MFTEVKQRRPRLALGWVTVREDRALRTCVRSSVWTLICDRPSIYPSSCWRGRKMNRWNSSVGKTKKNILAMHGKKRAITPRRSIVFIRELASPEFGLLVWWKSPQYGPQDYLIQWKPTSHARLLWLSVLNLREIIQIIVFWQIGIVLWFNTFASNIWTSIYISKSSQYRSVVHGIEVYEAKISNKE